MLRRYKHPRCRIIPARPAQPAGTAADRVRDGQAGLRILRGLDNLCATLHYPAVQLSTNPYAAVLRQASDRFFLNAVWLGDELITDTTGTLHRLSTAPESFGTPKPSHDANRRQMRLNLLLTACRAYAMAARKAKTHAVFQHNLRLTNQSV